MIKANETATKSVPHLLDRRSSGKLIIDRPIMAEDGVGPGIMMANQMAVHGNNNMITMEDNAGQQEPTMGRMPEDMEMKLGTVVVDGQKVAVDAVPLDDVDKKNGGNVGRINPPQPQSNGGGVGGGGPMAKTLGGSSDIQQHLQSMFYLLRGEETLKMAVKLESARAGRTRYLGVVSRSIKHRCKTATNRLSGSSNCSSNGGGGGSSTRLRKRESLNGRPPPDKLDHANDKEGGGDGGDVDSTNAKLMTNCQQNNAQSQVASAAGMDDHQQRISPIPPMTDLESDHRLNNAVPDKNIWTDTQSNDTIRNHNSCNSSSDKEVREGDRNNDNQAAITMATVPACLDTTIDGDEEEVAVFNYDDDRMNANDEMDSGDGEDADDEEEEESCLLGIDCNEKSTVGLVLRIYADTRIHLDGDGGFSVSVCGRTHIFKPVSVQAMWSALQTLHKVSSKARESNYFAGGPSHHWAAYYEDHIGSDQSCINEWFAMDSLESRRPPSPDTIRNKPTAREETEVVIRTTLKEIIMSVDLDEVTSKYIRGRLECHLDMDLTEYKSFIDEEMLVILGQMDSPTEIFDHVYLGSEWNASNLEELQRNGVRHILNVTREIDNFFPGMFDYYNIRVYDDETTDLLKHWDNTFKYITKARKQGSKVLVHCKMGISRSASVVIAYAMKANDWAFADALKHVKAKRSCIKPNKSFLTQLETYQGMLDAMRNKDKLQRSKSETNLKSTKDARLLPGSEPTPLIQALNGKPRHHHYSTYRRYQGGRDGKSKSEDEYQLRKFHEQTLTDFLKPNPLEDENMKENSQPVDASDEHKRIENKRMFMKNLNHIVLAKKEQQKKIHLNAAREEHLRKTRPRSWSQQLAINGDGDSSRVVPLSLMVKQKSQSLEYLMGGEFKDDMSSTGGKINWRSGRNIKTVRLPCSNGQNYSVSQNKVVHLTPDNSSSNPYSVLYGNVDRAKIVPFSTRMMLTSTSSDEEQHIASISSGGGGVEPESSKSKAGLKSSVRLIVSEIESSTSSTMSTTSATIDGGCSVGGDGGCNTTVTVIPGLRDQSARSRIQRDKRAMSLNLLVGETIPEGRKLMKTTNSSRPSLGDTDPRNVNKLVIKCDSSPTISGGGEIHRNNDIRKSNSTVIAITSTGSVSIENNNPRLSGQDEQLTVNGPSTSYHQNQPTSASQKKLRLDSDSFSKNVDRVFEREERRQSRTSIGGVTTTNTTATMAGGVPQKDLLISRQSSWSSVDSACVMGGYPSESNLRDLPSRHSSWGSGDTSRTTPSRNSSWGSYDMRSNPMVANKVEGTDGFSVVIGGEEVNVEDVPWHPGTVKRTKQKIEEREKGQQVQLRAKNNSPYGVSVSAGSSRSSSCRSLSEDILAKTKRNTICCGSDPLTISVPSSSTSSTTSNSSFCSTYTALNVLDAPGELSPGSGQGGTSTGIVQNLKMNFEMFASEEEKGTQVPPTVTATTVAGSDSPKPQHRSLPSSPVAMMTHENKPVLGVAVKGTKSSAGEEAARVEKKNVKNLVGKYEKTKVRSPDAKGTASNRNASKQRPKSTVISDRKSNIFGQVSISTPATPSNRKMNVNPFQFNIFTQPSLMMSHNKIKNGIYAESGGGGGGGKKGSAGAGTGGLSPRPPVHPAQGQQAEASAGNGRNHHILINRSNNMNHPGNNNNKSCGNVSTTASVTGVGSLGSGIKRNGFQQHGRTHPLTKLSHGLVYKQH